MATKPPFHSPSDKDKESKSVNYSKQQRKDERSQKRVAALLKTEDGAPAVTPHVELPAQPTVVKASYSVPAIPKWLTQALEADSVDSEGRRRVLQDGIDHINIGGRTELGRMLSHYAMSPFIHPYYGPFNCMEGFWYFVRAEQPDDKLRSLAGWRAKIYGKELPWRLIPNFSDIIMEANYFKIDQNPQLKRMLMESTLPFDHYYLHGRGNLLIRPAAEVWIAEGFEQLRQLFRSGKQPEPVTYPTP